MAEMRVVKYHTKKVLAEMENARNRVDPDQLMDIATGAMAYAVVEVLPYLQQSDDFEENLDQLVSVMIDSVERIAKEKHNEKIQNESPAE